MNYTKLNHHTDDIYKSLEEFTVDENYMSGLPVLSNS